MQFYGLLLFILHILLLKSFTSNFQDDSLFLLSLSDQPVIIRKFKLQIASAVSLNK